MTYVKASEILESNYLEIEAEIKSMAITDVVNLVWIPFLRYGIWVGYDGESIICARLIQN